MLGLRIAEKEKLLGTKSAAAVAVILYCLKSLKSVTNLFPGIAPALNKKQKATTKGCCGIPSLA